MSATSRSSSLQDIASGRIPPQLEEISLYAKELEILFDDYLLTGGVVKVIDDYRRSGQIPSADYKAYIDSLTGDLQRWEKRESYLRQVIRRIIDTLGGPVAWNTLKQETDLASHNTVADYVNTLRDAFATIILYHFDPSRSGPTFRKDKKIHFHDPFFFHALHAWTKGGDPFELALGFLKDPRVRGHLVEGVVADHVIRLAFALSSQRSLFDYENMLFYWRSTQAREVDFVLRMNGGSVPLEVKY